MPNWARKAFKASLFFGAYWALRLVPTMFLMYLSVCRNVVRTAYWKRRLGGMGKRCILRQGIVIHGPGKVVLGDDVSIAEYVHIYGGGGIFVGENTMIGPLTSITTSTHDYAAETMYYTLIQKPIRFGRDVWVGAGAVILPGVTIGDGAVIGAGAVVTKDVPAFTIAIGVPARVVAERPARASGGT
jgi:maltose O-acetyltransferase